MAVYDKFGSVRTDDKVTDDKPISALLLVDVRRSKTPLLKFKLPFVRLFHTSSEKYRTKCKNSECHGQG